MARSRGSDCYRRPVVAHPSVESAAGAFGDESPSTGSIPSNSGARWPTGRSLLRGARPLQWIKNILVFVAPAAAGVLHEPSKVLAAAGAFAAFCAAASGTYLVNDCLDAESDRNHPRKRNRPVASGKLSPRIAVTTGVTLMALAVTAGWLDAGWELALVIGAYVAVSVSYSLWLKHIAVIELAAVAAGFVLRAIAGGVATHVPLSNWFLVVTSFGALFMTVGKRTAEHHDLGELRAHHRDALGQYTTTFLRSALTMTATVTVTAYCLWALDRTGLVSRSGHRSALIGLTVVPVVIGVLYVLQLLDAGKGGAPETLVFHDRLLGVLGLAWLVLFTVGLYG